jgi:hypothetical protein
MAPDKQKALCDLIKDFASCVSESRETFLANLGSFSTIPEARIAYWASPAACTTFAHLPSLLKAGGVPQCGLSTKDDFRFLRLAWEVPVENISTSTETCVSSSLEECHSWVPFAKGGEYSPYFGDIHLLVDWTGQGKRLSDFVAARYPYLKGKTDWVLHPESSYFRSGLTYTRRTTSNFSPRFLPSGCIFSEKGLSIFGTSPESVGELLAVLMTRIAAFFIEMMVEAGDPVNSGGVARSYEINILSSVPVPPLSEVDAEELRNLGFSIWEALRTIDSRRETSRYFASPFGPGIAVGQIIDLASLGVLV